MSEYKVVYLIVERGFGSTKQSFWRMAGTGYVCRDGSINLKLDIHPGLTFNLRDAKSNGDVQAAAIDTWPTPKETPANGEDIPF